MTNPTQLFTTATIEISDGSETNLSAKDIYLLRGKLEEALNEAASNVLDQFGIVQENERTVFIEPIERMDEEDSNNE